MNMSEQRYICGLGLPINSDDPIRIITDREKDKDYFKFSDICEIMNEQQATITKLEQICETKMQEIEDIKYGLKDIAYKYRKEVQFKADTDPNQAVKEVLDEQQATIEQLRQSVEYWQKKYEEGTETFQTSENDTTFQFNSNQAQLYTIKNVSPNGVVRLGNGHKAQWRMKDVREINAELPPFEDFNRETFMQMRNKFRKFDKDVCGRIIYNIYFGTFGEYL